MGVAVRESGVFVDPRAVVDSLDVGDGTRVWAFTHVMSGAVIGRGCNIGEHCFIESGAIVGNDVTIKNHLAVWDGVTLEDGCFVGPGVTFTNDRYPRTSPLGSSARRYRGDGWRVPTLVKRGCTIGAGAVIVAGVALGEYCTVGAGAVVTKDTMPHSLVLGNPARQRGWVCRCGYPLRKADETWICDDCGLTYKQGQPGLLLNEANAENGE